MDKELIWASGVFEVLGSMGVWGDGGGRRVATIELELKRKDVLIRFQQALGMGSILSRAGRDTWIWRLRGDHSSQKRFIQLLWDNLTISRRDVCLKHLREINKLESLLKK